jgi:hypothetical protein
MAKSIFNAHIFIGANLPVYSDSALSGSSRTVFRPQISPFGGRDVTLQFEKALTGKNLPKETLDLFVKVCIKDSSLFGI